MKKILKILIKNFFIIKNIKNNNNTESSSDNKDPFLLNNINNILLDDDENKPSMKSEPLRTIIYKNSNISPDNLGVIDNNDGGNYLYLSIIYLNFNNFNHHRNRRYQTVNKLLQKAQLMSMITIKNNLGKILLLMTMKLSV